jgi:dCTP deaminase
VILTGPKITEAVRSGLICIDPFEPEMVNPNSHNYRLGPTLRVATDPVADPFRSATSMEIELPADGYVLLPNRVYLGTTKEKIGSHRYVPSLIGRSSLGRLGLFLQISADLGQLGAVHHWTLEIVATQPIRIYPGMVVGQVSFWQPTGVRMEYAGYYGARSEPTLWDPAAVAGVRANGPSTERKRP